MATNRSEPPRLRWLTALAACCLTMLSLAAKPADAATLTWGTSGTGGSGTWTATSGWWNGTTQQTWSNAPADDAVFGGGAGDPGGTITLTGGTTTANSITFNAFTGTYTIGTASQTLAVNSGGITLNAGAGAVTIQSSPITLGAAQSWTNNSASLFTVSSNITNGGNLLTVAGSGSTTLSGAIAGLGGLTKSGAGTLTLSASNSYSGSTTVNGGLIASSARGSFGTGSISIDSSATVRLTGTAGSYYIDGYQNTVTGSGGLEIIGQSTLTSVNYSGDLSAFTGTVTANTASGFYVGFGSVSSPSLNLTGSNAKFVIAGSGTFLPVINTSGTIAMGELSGSGNITSAYQKNTTYVIGNLATSSTFSGVIKESSAVTSLVKVGSGTLTLTGVNTYSGATTVNSGVLASSGANLSSFGSGAITIGASGTVRMTGTIGYYANGYTNSVSGSGVLSLVGQSNGYSVNYSGDLSGFTGTVSATAASGLYVGIGNTTSEAIRLSGSNTRFVVSGAGTLLPLTGNTGTTLATIALGELSGDGVIFARYGVDSTWQVGALSTSSTFSGRFQDNLNGSVGKNSLIKVGSGALTLSGSSSYSGGTQLNAGTIVVGHTAGLGAGTVTLGGGLLQSAVTGTIANPIAIAVASGTFDSQANANTLSGIISGNGGFVKTGGGTLTLSGTNTYSGTTMINGGLLTSPSNTGTTVRLSSFGSGPIVIGGSGTVQMTGWNGQTLNTVEAFYSNGYTNTVSGSGTLQLVGQNANFGVNLSGDLSGFTGTVSATAAAGLFVGIGNTASEAIRLSGSNTRFVVSGAGTLLPVTGTTGTTLATIALGELSGDGVISSKYGVDSTWQVGGLSTSSTFSGRFQDSSVGKTSLIKVGSGALTLSASSSYTGATTISGGRLAIGSSGQINGTSGITINGVGAELKYNSATALTRSITFTQGTLSGTGTINTLVTVGSGAIHSPGNSPGIQTVANETWDTGGTYLWEINDWNGTAGNVSNGFDQIAVTGTLNVAATNLSKFTIAITGLNGSNAVGVVPNFSNAARKTFTIATSGSLTGFAANKFTLDASSFTGSNSLNNGGFTIGNSGNDVVLTYIPSAVYNLSAAASAAAIRVGGTSWITATVTSSTATVTNPDSVAYGGLALSGGVGGLSSTSGTLAGGLAGSGSAAFTPVSSGSYAFNPSVTSATNVTIATTANAGSTSGVSVLVYNLASATNAQTINVGNMYAGSTKTAAVTLTNTAPNNATYTETLSSGSFTSLSNNYSATGSVSGIAGGSSGTGTLLVGLGSGLSAGAASGTTVLSLFSNAVNGSGLAQQQINSQTITITGGVYNLASATSAQTVNVGNFHVGDTATKAVTLANTAPVNATYTETLGSGGFSSTSSGYTATGSVTSIAGGSSGSGSLLVGFTTGSAGARNGSTVLSLNSEAVNSSGLGTAGFATQTITITGGVYNYAAATIASGTTIDFGTVLKNTSLSQSLLVRNSAPSDGFSEKLDAVFGASVGLASGSGSFNLLSAGGTSTALSVYLASGSAGAASGSQTVNFTSNGLGTSGLGTASLSPQTVSLTATVLDPALASFASGSAATTSFLIDFGSVNQNSSVSPLGFSLFNLMQTSGFTADLALTEIAQTNLAGPFSTNLSLFNTLAAGTSSGYTASFSTTTLGSFSNIYTLTFKSSNGGAVYTADTPQTLTLTVQGVIIVPEPGALALAGCGVALAGWMVARRKRRR